MGGMSAGYNQAWMSGGGGGGSGGVGGGEEATCYGGTCFSYTLHNHHKVPLISSHVY